ncbi:DEAD/DEAH box helicase [Metabacillus sp. GX 13764]|uniref:DEAD/DEAH box helicase n=1 Tax=Metabacillus kandeliae TaxID=2900151 RepID=UPI001E387F41|nr:SNF2 helicase associated domain-containing protein [Metabacillus kandeliae]MCD7035380.1 DEAD/DEAH box helicase [Metabacillus kandeliae]
MKIQLTKKIIEDRCGRVSMKTGEALCRSNKIEFEAYRDEECEAKVMTTEAFHVSVKAEPGGELKTACSCPKLVSFRRDCQHIAAVLLAVHEHQSHGSIPSIAKEPVPVPDDGLSDGLLAAFSTRMKRSSEQNYFEQREVLKAVFLLEPVQQNEGTYFQLVLSVESIRIASIEAFLSQLNGDQAIKLSPSFTFSPEQHCFSRETDAVFQELMLIAEEENADGGLILQPAAWSSLLKALTVAPEVYIQQNRRMENFRLSYEKLPLFFDLYEAPGGYELKADGLGKILLLKPYRAVQCGGTLYPLEEEDFARLAEIRRVLDASDRKILRIPPAQIQIYLDKVVPGLKRLGEVTLSENLSRQKEEVKFTAKLYLDRMKNRLLAGLEFHYGSIVFNPLNEKDIQSLAALIRYTEQEDIILKLMEESSFARTESGYFLQNELLEYEFLYEVLPKLEKFVKVYATTAVRLRIFKENRPPKIRVFGNKERTNWLEFKFDLDIPEMEIRKVLKALQEKQKYYRLKSGALLSLETREYKEIQRFLAAAPIQEEDWEKELEVPYIKGLQLLDAAASDIVEIQASFHEKLKSLLAPEGLSFQVPEKLEPVLREYQKHGFKWLKSLAANGFGGILADDMGLGKTVQSIAYILSELSEIRKTNKPVLIVCPSSLLYNWLSEFNQFSPEVKAVIVDGGKKVRSERLALKADVVITSYPLLRKDIRDYEKMSFHTVFFDEAQAFKNPLTQTAKAVKRIQAVHKFGLTGTPVENAGEELWALYHVVFPELFLGIKEYSNLTRKQIARRTRPFLLRRMKEDVLSELPEKIELTEAVDLLPEQKKLYAAYLAKLRHDTLKHLDKETIQQNRIKILAGITRLRQICCHPALFVEGYTGSSAKFEKLLTILEEARLSGRRVLIFSQFTKMLELIGRRLAAEGRPYFYLDGETPLEERVKLCRRFNAGERGLFLISLKAGGTGLNLTGADTVIHYDSWWNPAVEDQAADRAHRMGQENVVNVIKLVTRGTIEEKMNELQDRKRQLIKEIIDIEDKQAYVLTEEDIRDLLR